MRQTASKLQAFVSPPSKETFLKIPVLTINASVTPRANSTGNSAPSSTSGTLVSRADGVAENLLGLLAEYKQKVEELEGKLTTELQRGEDSLDIQNDIIAEKEDEIGMLQRELDDRKRKARDALARKDKECEERSESFRVEMQEKYGRHIAAAKGVVGSDLKGLGMKIGELEGTLDGL